MPKFLIFRRKKQYAFVDDHSDDTEIAMVWQSQIVCNFEITSPTSLNKTIHLHLFIPNYAPVHYVCMLRSSREHDPDIAIPDADQPLIDHSTPYISLIIITIYIKRFQKL